MKLKTLKTKTTVELPDLVTADIVTELSGLFKEALDNAKPITLSAKTVQHIDTLGCQLIVSLMVSCQQKNITLDIKNQTEAFETTIQTLGLDMEAA